VLGAAAGLEGDDALDLDLLAAPLQADLVGEGEEFVDAVVVEPEHGERLGVVEAFTPSEHLLPGEFEDVGGGVSGHGCSWSAVRGSSRMKPERCSSANVPRLPNSVQETPRPPLPALWLTWRCAADQGHHHGRGAGDPRRVRPPG